MTTYLDAILARKRLEVAALQAATPERELVARLPEAPPPRPLAAALSRRGGPTRVVAEVKRASPSAGAIAAGLDAVAQAAAYQAAGAAAISVLTDGPGFGGSLADLVAVRRAVDLPVLRKDFTVGGWQLTEARAAGADAALLIVAALDDDELRRLHDRCGELGLAALVEVHDEAELERALRAGAALVGVNNRNLHTFQVDLGTSVRLIPTFPPEVLAVAESGVRTPEDARRLRAAGAPNLLVGEALVRAADPGALLRELCR
ncbi:MAG: indole-3-glycerol phosphate synthase TrpC [Anaeromyxobacter sp.]|nr:indole-3-glycerol phosphate synthase TrpC [Anaeromyxobacter sp.]